MSTFTGRQALSVYRKSAFPRTQDGQHIVLAKLDGIASDIYLCIFAAEDEAAALLNQTCILIVSWPVS